MKNLQRETVRRIAPRTLVTAAALLALCAGVSMGTAQAADTENCHREVKRVTVWPKGPKAAQIPTRVEQRELTICDGKVVASRPVTDAELQKKGNGA
jgi:hypothetical protein